MFLRGHLWPCSYEVAFDFAYFCDFAIFAFMMQILFIRSLEWILIFVRISWKCMCFQNYAISIFFSNSLSVGTGEKKGYLIQREWSDKKRQTNRWGCTNGFYFVIVGLFFIFYKYILWVSLSSLFDFLFSIMKSAIKSNMCQVW